MFSAFQTFGRLGAGARAVAAAWTPAALWPTGTEPGMWIDPSNLASQWQDSAGTTPVSTPGTVADSSNPVGLALDLRLGAPTTLGPELAANGVAAWTPNTLQGSDGVLSADTSKFPSGGVKLTAPTYPAAGQAITGLVVGKTYKITAPVYSDNIRTSVIIGTDGNTNYAYVVLNQINTVNNLQLIFTAIATSMTLWFAKVIPNVGWAAGGGELFIGDTVSVKEIPGNHLLQATSTARPLVSARVNQYQYTEDPSNAVWTKDAVTYSSTSDPAGGNTGIRLSADAVAGSHAFVVVPGGIFWGAIRPGATYTLTFRVRANGISKAMLFANVYNGTGSLLGNFDLATGEVHSFSNCAPSIKPIGNGWFEISVSGTANSTLGGPIGIYMLNDAWSSSFTGNGVDGIDIWHPQFEFGLTATPYQSVPGDGSTYSSTGFPIYQYFDGTDDGMATASFAAGTLTSAMDCMIAVRRDSAGPTVLGLYDQNINYWFGASDATDSTQVCYGVCGTPTVWVDGVQLPGGIAVKRDTLASALPIGQWCILEFRSLDLSGWTAAGFGAYYTGFYFNNGQGGILLFPSSTSTADRDAARTWLGAKVGLTL